MNSENLRFAICDLRGPAYARLRRDKPACAGLRRGKRVKRKQAKTVDANYAKGRQWLRPMNPETPGFLMPRVSFPGGEPGTPPGECGAAGVRPLGEFEVPSARQVREFLTTDGHRWTRIKNKEVDANYANYREFFQGHGIGCATSATNRELFVNRIDLDLTKAKSGNIQQVQNPTDKSGLS